MKMSCCLVSEFNRAQESEGRPTAGAYAIRQWLKQHRPKVALHPHKVDYCDSCKHMEMELARLHQVIKRLCQSENASADNTPSNEWAVTEIEQKLRDHKTHATEAHGCIVVALTVLKLLWLKVR